MENPIEAEFVSDAVASATPEFSEIAALAYQLWTDRGCPIGSPEEDWVRAEKELSGRQETTAAAA